MIEKELGLESAKPMSSSSVSVEEKMEYLIEQNL